MEAGRAGGAWWLQASVCPDQQKASRDSSRVASWEMECRGNRIHLTNVGSTQRSWPERNEGKLEWALQTPGIAVRGVNQKMEHREDRAELTAAGLSQGPAYRGLVFGDLIYFSSISSLAADLQGFQQSCWDLFFKLGKHFSPSCFYFYWLLYILIGNFFLISFVHTIHSFCVLPVCAFVTQNSKE